MTYRGPPARLVILPAKAAPKVCILRRKPSRVFHVVQWDTAKDRPTHGSWFRGRLFADRCDISWDGERLVYMAMGADTKIWSGVCRLPWLKTECDAPETFGTWVGGGYWEAPGVLMAPWVPAQDTAGLPYRFVSGDPHYHAAARNGWSPVVPAPAGAVSAAACKPSPSHPTLRRLDIATNRKRTITRAAYEIVEAPGLLDETVQDATWDSRGQLLVARAGGIEPYSLADIARGSPGFRHSFEDLTPPWTSGDTDKAMEGTRP